MDIGFFEIIFVISIVSSIVSSLRKKKKKTKTTTLNTNFQSKTSYSSTSSLPPTSRTSSSTEDLFSELEELLSGSTNEKKSPTSTPDESRISTTKTSPFKTEPTQAIVEPQVSSLSSISSIKQSGRLNRLNKTHSKFKNYNETVILKKFDEVDVDKHFAEDESTDSNMQASASNLKKQISSPEAFKTAFIMNELLDKPLSMRK